jgi:hypothetical protein
LKDPRDDIGQLAEVVLAELEAKIVPPEVSATEDESNLKDVLDVGVTRV